MSDLTLFYILRHVISDYRVIAAFVTVLLYLNFIFYVVRYKKKKKNTLKTKLIKVKPAAAQPAAGTSQGTGEDGGTEEASEKEEI